MAAMNKTVANKSNQTMILPLGKKILLGGCLVLVLLSSYAAYHLQTPMVPFVTTATQQQAGIHCYPPRPLPDHLQQGPDPVLNPNRSDLSAMAQQVFFSKDQYNTKYNSMKELAEDGAPQNTVHVDNTLWLCVTPKTGCTGWIYFVLYYNDGILIPKESAKRNPGQIHQMKYRAPMTIYYMNRTEKEKIRRFSEYPHFLIARNPYVRFISSWGMWKGGDPSNRVNVTPTEFLEKIAIPGRWKIKDHVEPVSRNCAYHKPLNYTVLRVEEEALWFDGFMEKYGMAAKLKQYTEGGGPRLFESAVHDQSNFTNYLASVTGIDMWPGGTYESKHHQGSAKKFMQYYTPELAAKVTDYFMEDFRNFQYPLWDGNPDTFRFV